MKAMSQRTPETMPPAQPVVGIFDRQTGKYQYRPMTVEESQKHQQQLSETFNGDFTIKGLKQGKNKPE